VQRKARSIKELCELRAAIISSYQEKDNTLVLVSFKIDKNRCPLHGMLNHIFNK